MKKVAEVLFIIICIINIIHSFRNKNISTESAPTIIFDLVAYYIVYKFAPKDLVAEIIAVIIPFDIIIKIFFTESNTKLQYVLCAIILLEACTLSRLFMLGFITFKFV